MHHVNIQNRTVGSVPPRDVRGPGAHPADAGQGRPSGQDSDDGDVPRAVPEDVLHGFGAAEDLHTREREEEGFGVGRRAPGGHLLQHPQRNDGLQFGDVGEVAQELLGGGGEFAGER